ncbi:hypothetical protein A2415_03375 [candidate division WWE3 bacterium RIFOXYC1_FULL_39_7]|uniref:DUF2680 domain-containing protein n=2 Tax=Katanobacteria TaxID=422282 RepID=A0A1F4X9N3_UNCKA|nr:MAG: hypothetical protein A2415_03375 [candidate division WWE3 bacterium RIFOXYC1_FULL_39_7]OGC78349.1 MAG: hypothetical protein A2619_04960 [candidate division WWE3 bacterium RIFOXYD1_FULL_39_9]
MKKVTAMALVVSSLVVMGSISPVYADDSTGVFPSLLQRIMERFGLNKTDVETVIEQHRNEMQEQNRLRVENKLQEAVDNGTLSSEKKALLLQKMAEWQDNRGEWSDLTPEERHVKAEEHRNEMQEWAANNGIDLSTLGEIMGRGPSRGLGQGRGDGFGGGGRF